MELPSTMRSPRNAVVAGTVQGFAPRLTTACTKLNLLPDVVSVVCHGVLMLRAGSFRPQPSAL